MKKLFSRKLLAVSIATISLGSSMSIATKAMKKSNSAPCFTSSNSYFICENRRQNEILSQMSENLKEKRNRIHFERRKSEHRKLCKLKQKNKSKLTAEAIKYGVEIYRLNDLEEQNRKIRLTAKAIKYGVEI